jgi:PAS domain S-box-containing protein
MILRLPGMLQGLSAWIIALVEHLPQDSDERHRVYHFLAFLMLGIPAMLAFGIYNLWVSKLLLAGVIFAVALSAALAGILLPRVQSGLVLYRINLFFYAGMLLYMLVLGGEGGSKALWLFTFPLVAFFLMGASEGLKWTVAILLGACAIFWVVPGWIPVHRYEGQFTSRLLASFFIVSVLACWFEYLRQHYRKGMEAEQQRLVAERAALQDSEARFRNVVECASDTILVHDMAGRFLLCNQAACRNTGYSAEEILRMRVSDLQVELAEERLADAWQSLQPEQQMSLHGRHRRKDGTTFPVEVHLGLLNGEDPRRILAIVRDLGDRARITEAELRSRKAESLVLMAGSIAHDFNNLFQALMASMELAEVNSLGNPEVLKSLHKGKEVLRRAVSLSWKMLDFSGRAVSSMDPSDLGGLLASWAPELGERLGGAERLDLDIAEVPMINANPERLRKVLEAVLDKSIDAWEEAGGGAVRVRIRLFADFGEDRPGPHSEGYWVAEPPRCPATVCLEVSDNGPGAEPTVLPRMFDPFFTTKALGRGLGLASALGLLQAHRAGVHVIPGKVKGLLFRIHFPPAGT